MQGLTHEEEMFAQISYNREKKSILVAYLLFLFLGYLGIHRFYLRRNGSGFLMLTLTVVGILTTWILIGYIPLLIVNVWCFIDLFYTLLMVRNENKKIEFRIYQQILASRRDKTSTGYRNPCQQFTDSDIEDADFEVVGDDSDDFADF